MTFGFQPLFGGFGNLTRAQGRGVYLFHGFHRNRVLGVVEHVDVLTGQLSSDSDVVAGGKCASAGR